MKKTFLVAAAASIILSLCSPLSFAAMVNGSFAGSIYGAWGSSNGFDLTNLNDQPINGSFSYDPTALLSQWGTDGTTYNTAYEFSPTAPVTISGVVPYQSSSFVFDYIGDSLSEVYAAKNYLGTNANWLYIQASQSDSSDVFISLQNTIGLTYLSNVQDLGSLNFTDSSPDSYGVIKFNPAHIISNEEGAFSFTITSASSAGSVANRDTENQKNQVPEPASIILLGIGLGLSMTHKAIRK